jgi:uncharacterized phage-associated protein
MIDEITLARLGNALLYWLRCCEHHDRTNLYKFVYYFDFAKAKLTGKPVFNFTYRAMKWGPVPREVEDELNNIESSRLRNYISFEPYKDEQQKQRYSIQAKVEPDLTVFSRKEQEVLEKVCYVFKEAPAKLMSDATHAPGEPWARAYNEKGNLAPVDISLALVMDGFGEPDDPDSVREKLDVFRQYKLTA